MQTKNESVTMERFTEDIVIVGAGVAGLTTSLALHRMGLKSLVLEAGDSLRVSGYALVLTANAWRALDAVGTGDSLREHHLLLQGQQLIPIETGVPLATTPLTGKGKRGNRELRCVKRKLLLEMLQKDLPPGTIRFSSKVVSIEESTYSKLLYLADGSTITTKILIGCDGISSIVGKWLGLPAPFEIGRSSIRGLAEFPNGHGLDPLIFLHSGQGFRFGCIPCNETAAFWFFSMDSTTASGIGNKPAELKQFVIDKLGGVCTQANIIIEKTDLNNLFMCSLKMRWPLDILSGSIHKGNACVAGDSFHTMTPDISQGACSALEDAVVLARYIAEAFKSEKTERLKINSETAKRTYMRIENILAKYAKERVWRCFMIATISYLTTKLHQRKRTTLHFLFAKILSSILTRAQFKIVD